MDTVLTPGKPDSTQSLRSRSALLIKRAPLPMVEVQGSAHFASYVNSAFCSLLGKTRAELVGIPFAELVPGGDACVPILDRVYETGEAVTHAQEAGSEPDLACWLYTMWPALDTNERVVGVIIQVTTTTEFRQNVSAINEGLLIAGLRPHELPGGVKYLNRQLQESEQRYRVLFDMGPVAVFSCDRMGIVQDYNQRAAELWGREPKRNDPSERYCGSFRMYRLDGSLMLHSESPILEVLRSGTPAQNAEVCIERPDGSRIVVVVNFAPLRDEDGTTIGAITAFYDITERRHGERQLLEQSRQQQQLYQFADTLNRGGNLEAVFEAALDTILVCLSTKRASILLLDENGVMRFKAWRGLSDDYRRAAEGHSPWRQDAGDPQPVCIGNVAEMLPGGALREITQPEGIGALAFIPLVDQGRLLGKFEVYYDAPHAFTEDKLRLAHTIAAQLAFALERRHAAEALREAAKLLCFMAESMPQKTFTATPAGKLEYLNRQWVEFTGLAFEQIKGGGWTQFIHPDDVEGTVRHWKHSLATGEAFQSEHRLRRQDGVYRWHLSRAHAMRDAQGKVVMWMGSDTDIEDQKHHASQLEEQVSIRTADLRSTTSQLEAFVYSIAHDLRAPLRSMEGFAQILLTDYAPNLDATGREYAAHISESAHFLDSLLRDLLAFAQLSQQRIELAPVKLEAAVQAVRFQCEMEIHQKNARLELVAPWPTVLAHAPILGQVLVNLITNAIKFVAPNVPPQLRLWAEEHGKTVRLWVQDNGIGIHPENQARIFQVFQRLHTTEYAGTGIGLAIVQKGIERMGGHVGVESAPGKGSRFWLELAKA